jgi:hypothetical protein
VVIVAGAQQSKDSQEDCRKGWKHSQLQSDRNKFARRANRNKNMVTKSHGCGGKKNHQQPRKDEMDKELIETRAIMEELSLRVQQSTKSRWVYEWPMKMKAKWPVKELLARRQHKLLKRWLGHDESLRDEQDMVHICEPEDGRNLSDTEDELRSLDDPKDCQEGRTKNSVCQEGNEMRSLEDLIDYHEGREEIPYFQVGKGNQMRLSESLMNSEVSSDHREELMEKEDQTHFLIIGGIEVFLPYSLVEAREDGVGAATERQPTQTVMEEEME